MEQQFPFTTDLLTLSLFFLVSLAVLHVVLIWWLKLGKIGWKYVDYIWLVMALLGLLSAASDARRLIATNLLERQKILTASTYENLRRQIQFGAGPSFCRQFIRSQYSPPNLDETQIEFDRVCEYYKGLLATMPARPLEKFERIELPSAVKRPAVTDKMLLDVFYATEAYIQHYNENQKALEELTALQQRSGLEVDVAMFAPVLIAAALALRITKVTGEVLLEKQTKKSKVT